MNDEPVLDAAAKAAADEKAKTDAAAADALKKTENAIVNAPFETAKISDADFAKVFDDPRTFEHSRFKELTAAQKELNELKANKAKEEEQKLIDQKKFEELATKNKQEAETLRVQLNTERINNNLLAAASKLGVVDPDAVLKLVDRSAIAIDATTGAITGTEEALKKLLEEKTYLAGKPGTQKLGTASAPGAETDTGDLKRFKWSQLQDPEFYRANEKDILASMKANLIEDDRPGIK